MRLEHDKDVFIRKIFTFSMHLDLHESEHARTNKFALLSDNENINIYRPVQDNGKISSSK